MGTAEKVILIVGALIILTPFVVKEIKLYKQYDQLCKDLDQKTWERIEGWKK